jgi:hypothetical protein
MWAIPMLGAPPFWCVTGCLVCGGLEGGDFGGLCSGLACGAFLPVAFNHFFNHVEDCGSAFSGLDDFGGWGEEAEVGIGCDLFDGLGFGFGVLLRSGEVEAGDL